MMPKILYLFKSLKLPDLVEIISGFVSPTLPFLRHPYRAVYFALRFFWSPLLISIKHFIVIGSIIPLKNLESSSPGFTSMKPYTTDWAGIIKPGCLIWQFLAFSLFCSSRVSAVYKHEKPDNVKTKCGGGSSMIRFPRHEKSYIPSNMTTLRPNFFRKSAWFSTVTWPV